MSENKSNMTYQDDVERLISTVSQNWDFNLSKEWKLMKLVIRAFSQILNLSSLTISTLAGWLILELNPDALLSNIDRSHCEKICRIVIVWYLNRVLSQYSNLRERLRKTKMQIYWDGSFRYSVKLILFDEK